MASYKMKIITQKFKEYSRGFFHILMIDDQKNMKQKLHQSIWISDFTGWVKMTFELTGWKKNGNWNLQQALKFLKSTKENGCDVTDSQPDLWRRNHVCPVKSRRN